MERDDSATSKEGKREHVAEILVVRAGALARACMHAMSWVCVQTKWRISSHSSQVFLRHSCPRARASERARAACKRTFTPVSGRVWKIASPRDCDVFVRWQSICAGARRQHACQSLCVRQTTDPTWQWMDATVSSHTSHCGCRIPGHGRTGDRGETQAGVVSGPVRDRGDSP
jgi:hypothetical protein